MLGCRRSSCGLSAECFVFRRSAARAISGVLAREPIAKGAISSTVNGGLESFVTAAAAELPRGLRINAVSPSVIEESLVKSGDYFPGFPAVPVAAVAEAFFKSVDGIHTGRVYALG